MKVLKQWDNAAELFALEQEQSEFSQVNKRVVKERFISLQNQTLLDLGGGYGWYTNYFAEAGADVTGCDGSGRMLEIARRTYPEIHFQQVDILGKLPYKNEAFDIVFCNQVLMDIDPIKGVIAEVNRITKKGGIFYMAIVHPAFYDCSWGKDASGYAKTKIMERYLSEYSFDNEYWGKTRHYHRTVSYYVNTIIDSGFRLVHLEEPRSYDGIRKSDEFPLFLFAEFLKLPNRCNA